MKYLYINQRWWRCTQTPGFSYQAEGQYQAEIISLDLTLEKLKCAEMKIFPNGR